MAYWYFCGGLVYFPPFWYVLRRKIWQHCIWRVLCLGCAISDLEQIVEKEIIVGS
jgi:hypothetical protein